MKGQIHTAMMALCSACIPIVVDHVRDDCFCGGESSQDESSGIIAL